MNWKQLFGMGESTSEPLHVENRPSEHKCSRDDCVEYMAALTLVNPIVNQFYAREYLESRAKLLAKVTEAGDEHLTQHVLDWLKWGDEQMARYKREAKEREERETFLRSRGLLR